MEKQNSSATLAMRPCSSNSAPRLLLLQQHNPVLQLWAGKLHLHTHGQWQCAANECLRWPGSSWAWQRFRTSNIGEEPPGGKRLSDFTRFLQPGWFLGGAREQGGLAANSRWLSNAFPRGARHTRSQAPRANFVVLACQLRIRLPCSRAFVRTDERPQTVLASTLLMQPTGCQFGLGLGIGSGIGLG
jgi:hypothetical protein